MADTVKKTKATATPRQASAKNMKATEAAEPTTTSRKGIELVPKVEAPMKTKAVAVAAKPRKTATKKDNVTAISQPARNVIEQLAYQYWAQRGYQHGNSLQDWLRAEQELQERVS
jgi:hypothetical protein